jgi:hypothetical protein
MLLPYRAILREDERPAILLIETVEPTWAKSRTLMEELRRAIDRNDKAEAIIHSLTIDNW